MNSDWVGAWLGLPDDGPETSSGHLGTPRRHDADRRTLRYLWLRLRRLGVARVADLTELDCLGIPVVSAIRPGVDRSQITLAQGKGPTLVSATVSALMEAAERNCAAQPRPVMRASVEYVRRQGERFVGPRDLGVLDWNEEAIVEWVAARAFDTGEKVWLPAAEVQFPYFAPEGLERPVRPSTSGLAAGGTRAEAVLHGLLEVIERHAVSCLHDGGEGQLVDLATVTDGTARELVGRFRAAQVDLFALDLGAVAVAPTYLVLTLDQNWVGPPKIIGGQGSHLDAATALRRALYEAAQSRIVALQGSREDLERHAPGWVAAFDETRERFELLRRHGALGGSTGVPSTPPAGTIQQMTTAILDRLARAGFQRAVWTDLSDPALDLAVVHVCVPGCGDGVVRSARIPHAP